jgi:succinate dehydrogenase/fumarate reductase cytochrome b subunit
MMRQPGELLGNIKMLGYSILTFKADFLYRITGVVEVGLFVGMAKAAYFGAAVSHSSSSQISSLSLSRTAPFLHVTQTAQQSS